MLVKSKAPWVWASPRTARPIRNKEASNGGTLLTVNHRGARHNGETVTLRNEVIRYQGLPGGNLVDEPNRALSLIFLHQD